MSLTSSHNKIVGSVKELPSLLDQIKGGREVFPSVVDWAMNLWVKE